jgi:Kef-type K+ transport system membrane component KefB
VDAVLLVDDLVAVFVVALLAPVVVGLLPRLPVPQVVLLLAGGILIGPDVLGLSTPGGVQVLADVGLGFVFLLAGYEVDLRLFGQDAGRRAVLAWFVSLVLALGAVGLLAAAGLVRAFVPVALGLTTTALGTLLPVLREHGLLGAGGWAAGDGGRAGPARDRPDHPAGDDPAADRPHRRHRRVPP